MPTKAARYCRCGKIVASGTDCPICTPARKREADAHRPSARARGYDSKWDVERAAYLKAHPSCTRQHKDGSTCGAPSTVVHHIIPHRGNQKLFWSRSNWAARCKPCHDRFDQSNEKAPPPGGPNFGKPARTGAIQRREFFGNSGIFSGGS
jgi:5-methylcytosine-specific restriction endonuclease McrA